MGSRMYLALVPPAEVIEAVDDIIDEFSRRQHPHDPRKTRWARHGGAHPEGGTFSPHVTLARCHRGDLTGEVDALSTFRTDTWLARTVSLIESVADSTGFHAQVVGEAVLNGLDWDQIRSPK